MACFGNGVTTTSTSTNISNANNGTIAQLLKELINYKRSDYR